MNNIYEILKNNTSIPWNLTKDPCSWKGVNCTSSLNQSFITQLSLTSLSLSTTDFLPVMCHISTLEAIDLSNNLLTFIPDGFITGCGNITGLTSLNFSRNYLVGNLPTFVGFENLEKLDLSQNALNGNISLQLSGLNSLRILNLGLNMFSGNVPTRFGGLFVLEELYLYDNNFHGEIPEKIANYSNLVIIDLSRNNLVGNLPNFVGFKNLEKLDLSRNSLNGNISLQLSSLNSLRILNLGFNMFSGYVPTRFGELFVLEELYLYANKFHGEIPEMIANYSNLVIIDLSANRLDGSIPDRVQNLSKLDTFVLSSNLLSGEIAKFLLNIKTLKRFAANMNNFSGILPSGLNNFLVNLDLSFNRLSGSIPFDLLSQPNLQTVDLSDNSFNGSIPENLSPSLVRLRLGGNLLSGKIQFSSFENLRNLTYLELENNNLDGSIPQGLGMCKDLALLNLANNELTGNLPLEFGNLSNLQELKLQSNKFEGEIPIIITKLHGLRKLNFSRNLLNGSIPSSVSNLLNLTYLDLSCNNLSGSIPDSISDLNSLIQLELGDNRLSGKIPLLPQHLQISLNLSGNLFHGPIPETLSKVRELEVLDLSNNKFSGKIPNYLASITTLTTLDLSNNILSGLVPDFPPYILVHTSGNKDLIIAKKGPSPTLHPKRKTLAMGIIISIVVAVVVAIGILTIVSIFTSKFYYNRNQQQVQSHEDLSQPEILRGALLTRNPIHRSNIDFAKAMELVIDPSKIVLETKFSTYYKAIMPSGLSYFVKKVKMFQSGTHDRFEEEFQVLSKLSNTFIMTPLAYFLTVDSAYIFYEYSRMGTLFDALHNQDMGKPLDWASRYSIAIGVAQGLAYLHVYNSGPILLLDLSSKSVLLRSHKEPKIGDIELWKVIDLTKNTTSLSAVAGSVGYIPPEYAYKMRVTMAGNVYSLGVILLELLTGRPAISRGIELAKWVPLIIHEKRKDLDHIFDNNINRTSTSVKNQMLAVLKVALACVCDSPDARPNTKSVVRMLQNAR